MKKIYLVLVAMLFPFLANDLYGATQQGGRRKTSTAKKKTGATNNKGQRGGKPADPKAGGSKTRGGKATTKGSANTSAKRKPLASGRNSGAQSSPNSDAEINALQKMEGEEQSLIRGEAGLSKRLAMISNQIKQLSGQVGPLSDDLSSIQGALTEVESKIEQTNENVRLTCNGGNSQGISDPTSDLALQDANGYDDPNDFLDDVNGGGYQGDSEQDDYFLPE
jgi:hypothetical protein